jgi:hypothetical protein
VLTSAKHPEAERTLEVISHGTLPSSHGDGLLGSISRAPPSSAAGQKGRRREKHAYWSS